MATTYSNWSDTWRPSGSSVDKKYRARLDTSVGYDNTRYWVTATVYVNINSTVEAWYWGRVSASSQSTYTSGKVTTAFNGATTVYAISTTYYWSRSTSAYTVSVTGEAMSNKKTWDGYWMPTTQYFTVPALPSYTVSYNANEGSVAPAAQTKWYNITLSLQPATVNPIRSGYTFVEWNTLPNPTETSPGTIYRPSGSYTANAGATLYAQWTPNEYVVSYNKNDAAATGEMNSSTFTYNSADNLSVNTFVKKDYLFAGWATAPDGMVQYTDGQEILNLSTGTTITLYAIWKKQYTAPDLQNPVAYRTTAGLPDDVGTGFFTSVYVIPGIKEISLNTYDTHRETTVSAFYKNSADSNWIQIDSDRTTSKIDSYIITIPTTTTFDVLENNAIASDSIYDVKFVAEVIEKVLSNDTTVDSNKNYYTYDSTQDIFTQVTPIGNENPFELEWYEDEIKISNAAQTIIPASKFLFDANPTNNTMALFTSAPDGSELEDSIVLGSEGDLQIEYEESAGEGQLDYDINQALAALAGEDASLNNVPLSYVGGATLGASTVTLSVANWSNNSQTVLVNGVTTNSIVLATPAPSSYDEYVVNNIRCTGQSTGELTFTCDFIPSSELVINIINIVIA